MPRPCRREALEARASSERRSNALRRTSPCGAPRSASRRASSLCCASMASSCSEKGEASLARARILERLRTMLGDIAYKRGMRWVWSGAIESAKAIAGLGSNPARSGCPTLRGSRSIATRALSGIETISRCPSAQALGIVRGIASGTRGAHGHLPSCGIACTIQRPSLPIPLAARDARAQDLGGRGGLSPRSSRVPAGVTRSRRSRWQPAEGARAPALCDANVRFQASEGLSREARAARRSRRGARRPRGSGARREGGEAPRRLPPRR